MLSLVLALALAQPIVTNNCAPGRNCRVRSLQASGSGGAVIIPTAAFINFYGISSGTTGIRGTGAGIGVEGTSFYTGTGSHVSLGASAHLTMAGFVNSTTFTNPATLPNASTLAADSTTAKLYRSDGAVWSDVGAGQHDVFDGRSFTIAFAAGTGAFAWKTAPRIGGTDMTAITETCATATGEAQLSSAAGAFGTFTRTGRSCATSAVLNNVASVATPNVAGTYTAGSNNRFRTCQYFQLSSVASVRTVVGQLPVANFAAPTDTPTAMGAWFRYSTSAGDTNWMLCTSDSASAATCTSTGVAATAGTATLLCIDKREGSAVVGWVNGRARVRQTTNLPLTGTGAALGFATQTLSAAVVTQTSSPVSLEVF